MTKGKAGIHAQLTVAEDAIQFGDVEIAYTITRSRRRKKTISIKLNASSRVIVAAPCGVSIREIRGVVLKHAAWIVRKATEVAEQPRRRELVTGDSLLLFGHEAGLLVEHANVRRVMIDFEGGCFRIAVPARFEGEPRRNAVESALLAWYKARASEYFLHRVLHWAKVIELTPSRILVRDQRQRWGSCSADGTLRLNWRLIMAPPALIDYVVVHELVHLRVKNHSRDFWSAVEVFMPDYKARRSALKEMSSRLTI